MPRYTAKLSRGGLFSCANHQHRIHQPDRSGLNDAGRFEAVIDAPTQVEARKLAARIGKQSRFVRSLL